jgi:hypothetical protein
MIKKLSRIHNIDKPEYKEFAESCAGLKYFKPTTILKVKHINRYGSFCQQCTTDLLQPELDALSQMEMFE